MHHATELVAVGNWRVIGNDTARLLASRGAHLVHSAPSVGVRDWSDLRIAVAAGAWLAAARPGDLLEIVTDDQAFDAVGDVAASLGVRFRRLSYRALAGMGEVPRGEPAREPSTSAPDTPQPEHAAEGNPPGEGESAAGPARRRRRRRGGRRRRGRGSTQPAATTTE